MNTLIESLKAIEATQLEDSDDTILNNMEEDNPLKELINTALCQADEVLVTDQGQCNWENHEVLKNAGFPVFPGERDRFGWLSGCIQTKKGILVFG
jgi:hypothetical protein